MAEILSKCLPKAFDSAFLLVFFRIAVVEIRLAEMYPGFRIVGSSGPLQKFGGPLQSFGGPANL